MEIPALPSRPNLKPSVETAPPSTAVEVEKPRVAVNNPTSPAPPESPSLRRLGRRVALRLPGHWRTQSGLLITVGIIICLVTALFVLREGSGPGKPAAQKSPDPVVGARNIQSNLAPEGPLKSIFLAPGTKEWWAVAGTASARLELATLPTPGGLKWVGVTTQKAKKATAGSLSTYQAAYLGFSTPAAAKAWLDAISKDDTFSQRAYLLRGNTVTMTPPWVDPYSQPFKLDTTLQTNIDIDRGYWAIDIDAWIAGTLEETPSPGAVRIAAAATGFGGKDVAWSATSDSPTGPWVGTVRGFAAEDVNVSRASQAINLTSHSVCGKDGNCIEDDPGISHLVYHMALADKDVTWGALEMKEGLPVPGTVLSGVWNQGLAPGQLDGSISGDGLTLPWIYFEVTAEGKMTLTLSAPKPQASP